MDQGGSFHEKENEPLHLSAYTPTTAEKIYHHPLFHLIISTNKALRPPSKEQALSPALATAISKYEHNLNPRIVPLWMVLSLFIARRE